MIHWFADMGPAFTYVYLGILAIMLVVGVRHVLQWRDESPPVVEQRHGIPAIHPAVVETIEEQSNSAAADTPRLMTAPTPQPAPPAERQPLHEPPSRLRVLAADTIAIGFCVAMPMLLILAAQFGWLWMRSAWLYFLVGIIFFMWLGALGVVFEMLFDAAEKRWPGANAVKKGLISIWRFIVKFHSYPDR